jgi:hypothetical protein
VISNKFTYSDIFLNCVYNFGDSGTGGQLNSRDSDDAKQQKAMIPTSNRIRASLARSKMAAIRDFSSSWSATFRAKHSLFSRLKSSRASSKVLIDRMFVKGVSLRRKKHCTFYTDTSSPVLHREMNHRWRASPISSAELRSTQFDVRRHPYCL